MDKESGDAGGKRKPAIHDLTTQFQPVKNGILV
jgi:hypothetical protein